MAEKLEYPIEPAYLQAGVSGLYNQSPPPQSSPLKGEDDGEVTSL
jgi:hypothetical protein